MNDKKREVIILIIPLTGSSGGVFDTNGDDVPTVSYSSILHFINQPEQEPGAMEENGIINYRMNKRP